MLKYVYTFAANNFKKRLVLKFVYTFAANKIKKRLVCTYAYIFAAYKINSNDYIYLYICHNEIKRRLVFT